MSLKQQIQEDLISAMKENNQIKKDAIRMLKAAVMKWEVSGPKKEATDEDIIPIIKKEIKQRKESSEQLTKGNRPELAEKEEKEIVILQKYLPQELSEEKITEVTKEVIKETGAKSAQDFGNVMRAVMAKLKGQADGSMVNQIVKKLLS
jgi:uncharacterized protein